MPTAKVNVIEMDVNGFRTGADLQALKLASVVAKVTLSINNNSAAEHTCGSTTRYAGIVSHADNVHGWFGDTPATANDPLFVQGGRAWVQVTPGTKLQFFNSSTT